MKKNHLVDLHIHSSFSDGKLSIAEIVELYGRRGFSAIAVTDHLADSNTLTGLVANKLKLSLTRKNMEQYLQVLQVESRRAREKYNMLLLPGVEVTLNSWSKRNGAHIVFLNVDQYIDPNVSIESLLQNNRRYFSIAAHPLWEEAYEFKTTHLWENRPQLAPHLDAWECATAHRFSQAVYLSGMPIIASSDFHGSLWQESWKSQTYIEDMTTENLFLQIRNREIEPVWI